MCDIRGMNGKVKEKYMCDVKNMKCGKRTSSISKLFHDERNYTDWKCDGLFYVFITTPTVYLFLTANIYDPLNTRNYNFHSFTGSGCVWIFLKSVVHSVVQIKQSIFGD